jgi:hypothetical protein
MTVSPPIRMRVLPASEIVAKSAGLSPYSWSEPLATPSLTTKAPRQSPFAPLDGDYPDRAANENTSSAIQWIWSNKLLWIPALRAMLGVGSPANSTTIFWSTTLWSYWDTHNLYQVYECPLTGTLPLNPSAPQSTDYPATVGHLFDNNCASLDRGLLFKQTVPKSLGAISRSVSVVDAGTDTLTFSNTYTGADTQVQFASTGTLPAPLVADTDYWLIPLTSTTFKVATSFANSLAGTAINLTDPGTGTTTVQIQPNAGFVQPQIIALSLAGLTTALSTGNFGAAYAGNLGRAPESASDARNSTASAIEYMPNMGAFGSLVQYHKDHYWIYTFDSASGISGSWGPQVTIPNMVEPNALHNMGHRHPVTDVMVLGGGSFDGTGSHNRQMYTLSNAGVLNEFDALPTDPNTGLPIVVSVNNGSNEALTRACMTYDPGSPESIVFHRNGNIYALHTAQRTVRTIGANAHPNVCWVCSVPAGSTGTGRSYGVIACGFSTPTPVGQASVRLYRAA